MATVEIRRRNPDDASTETLARVYVPDGSAAAAVEPVEPGDLDWLQSVVLRGIVGRDGVELTMDDGELFVEALPWSLRGSRLWAEVVD